MPITDDDRQMIATTMNGLDEAVASIEKIRAPLVEEMKPYDEALDRINDVRAMILEQHGDLEIAGKCDRCGKLLFVGDPGTRPYIDDEDTVYCDKHGMTYALLYGMWAPPIEGTEEEIEARKHALALVEAHIAADGSLDDIIPGVL